MANELRNIILGGLAMALVGCGGPKGSDIQEQRRTGCETLTYTVTTRTEIPFDRREKDAFSVKYCVNDKDRCLTEEEAVDKYVSDLQLLKAKALHEARQ